MSGELHLQDELTSKAARVVVATRYGPVTGGKADNGANVFLEIPYALPPGRFEDPKPLPSDYTYEAKEYIYENSYAAQPRNDGQTAAMRFEDKVGYGKPSENPLFLNVYVPPSYPEKKEFPVKVYIHGGFLQFGSPHTCGSQAHFIAAARSEVWVNIGYRLSAFGFIASDQHGLSGNYGFKDQWLALQWIKENISAFGGNPNDIQITGVSAGAHSVHQLLNRASRLPEGVKAPFTSAILQSNAMLTDPKTPEELHPQFEALCSALGLDSDDDDIVVKLRDTSAIPASEITRVVEEEKLGSHGTFRGCLSDDWIQTSPGPMQRQRNGDLGRGLKQSGVRFVATGEVSEEWYLYSIAHPVQRVEEIKPNLQRYFSPYFTDLLLFGYPELSQDAAPEMVQRKFGEILSAAQVYLPVRVFVRDLAATDFPVFRYEIRWAPEQVRPLGYVTHGTDRPIWTLRLATLTKQQEAVSVAWLDEIEKESARLIQGGENRDAHEILVLRDDATIQWSTDGLWEEYEKLAKLVLA